MPSAFLLRRILVEMSVLDGRMIAVWRIVRDVQIRPRTTARSRTKDLKHTMFARVSRVVTGILQDRPGNPILKNQAYKLDSKQPT